MRKVTIVLAVVAAMFLSATAAGAASTAVRGHQDRDGTVVGNYRSVYAYDASQAYFWDLGDGRVFTSSGIGSIDDLDQATLTTCTYRVHYRGDFGGDPFLDEGWTANQIVCRGYEGTYTVHYRTVWAGDYPMPDLEILSGNVR